jgi:hypothetical protein
MLLESSGDGVRLAPKNIIYFELIQRKLFGFSFNSQLMPT